MWGANPKNVVINQSPKNTSGLVELETRVTFANLVSKKKIILTHGMFGVTIYFFRRHLSAMIIKYRKFSFSICITELQRATLSL